MENHGLWGAETLRPFLFFVYNWTIHLMDDEEYLEKYEPVLRFAQSERFFPMAVEAYLDQCRIFPGGPEGLIHVPATFYKRLVNVIGKLPGHQYFLRFVNDPLIDADIWVWWGVLSAVAIVLGWFTTGLIGVEIAVILSLVAALIIFMQASPIRLRIIPATLAALFFMTLEILPIWFFLRPHAGISLAVEYLLLLPIYLVLLFYLSVRTMKFIFDHIIPEAPGVLMDMLSQATETVAHKAYFQYAKILERESQPVYYGRVLNEQDDRGNSWKILQYHFFYAFNDWRLAANGMNHHEGDWEMAAIYLKNDEPHALLLSQHGSGAMEPWKNVHRVVSRSGNASTHPIVYVALGSHANYSKPEIIRLPRLYKAGFIQRFLYWADGLIHFFFLLINPNQKARQNALRELIAPPQFILTEENIFNLRDEEDHYVVSLPLEIATGDGIRIGPQGNTKTEPVQKSSSYLKRNLSDRKVTHPETRLWRRILLSPEPDWVQYKGLWGVKSLIENESGPPGPKWNRPGNLLTVKERLRWAKPLEWFANLENNER